MTNAGAASPLFGPPANGFAPPPPTTAQCQRPPTGPHASCNPEDGAAQLDTEQTASLARDASVLFYLAYAPNYDGKGDNAEALQLADYEVQQAISDNAADVLSLSYGTGEQDHVGGDFVLLPNGMVDPVRTSSSSEPPMCVNSRKACAASPSAKMPVCGVAIPQLATPALRPPFADEPAVSTRISVDAAARVQVPSVSRRAMRLRSDGCEAKSTSIHLGCSSSA